MTYVSRQIAQAMLMLTLLVSVGCSHYQYHNVRSSIYGRHGLIKTSPPAYQNAHEVEGLKIPAGLSRKMIRPLYTVPPIAPHPKQLLDREQLILPPGSVTAHVAADEQRAYRREAVTPTKRSVVSGKSARANYRYTSTAGRETLVLAKSVDQAWHWLAAQFQHAGVRIVSRDLKHHRFVVEDASGMLPSANRLINVSIEPLTARQSQVWLSGNFGYRLSHVYSSLIFDRLLKRV